MIKKTIRQTCLNLAVSLCLTAPSLLQADDTDVLQLSSSKTSNILFIMDLSGSMKDSALDNSTRLGVLKEALSDVIEQAKPHMRLGLMTFGPGEDYFVQGVQFPISDISHLASEHLANNNEGGNLNLSPNEDETVKKFLVRITQQWQALGATPIVDALYEAALYFRGETMDWGNAPQGSLQAAHPLSFDSTSKKYLSPITQQCQDNYIVLLSDGLPTFNLLATSPLAESIKAKQCSATGMEYGQCGPEITHMLATQDQNPYIAGEQTVTTFAIGLGNSDPQLQQYMQRLVTAKDDPSTPEREGYFTVQTKDQLLNAFNHIINNTHANRSPFSSPSYSLSTDNNGMSHDGNVYVPFAAPSKTAAWMGNLKKFKLIHNKAGERIITGKNAQPAFNDLGEVQETGFDFWSVSDAPDGINNLQGGVASVLKATIPEKRALYSNITSDKLTSSSNHIAHNNKALTSELLNASASDRQTLIKYIRGLKASQTSNTEWVDNDKGIGDILHFSPLSITYNDNKKYLLVGTNEGFLHAFDESNGKEVFAFMPKALLPNIKKRYENKPLSGNKPHIYGIDGKATLWHDDKNQNGKVDKDQGERAYLYFGLRRGGTGYYALDITDINSPSLLWSYNTDASNKTMGQSWSKPYLSRTFDKDDKLKKIIVITGGYDPVYDKKESISQPPASSLGNNIIILDAEKGHVLWTLQTGLKEGLGQAKHSIPGGARLLDINRNGALDRLYFGDTGGNLWRLDINESLDQSKNFTEKSQLTQLASLGGEGEEARQFYNEPELSILKHNTITSLAIAIGSGLRPHPMSEEIDDHLFVLLDRYVNSLPPKTSTNTQAPPPPTEGISLGTEEVTDSTQTNTDNNNADNTTEEDDNNTCIIYSNSNKTAGLFNFYEGSLTATSNMTNALICKQGKHHGYIPTATASGKNSWDIPASETLPTGKNCIDIPYYDQHQLESNIRNRIVTIDTSDNQSTTQKLGTLLGGNYFHTRRVCESYDDPALDPLNAIQDSLVDFSSKISLFLDICKNSSSATCSEQMPHSQAVATLREKTIKPSDSVLDSEYPMVRSYDNPSVVTAALDLQVADSSKTNKGENTVTLSQLAEIKVDEKSGILSLDYGTLTDTNLIDGNIAGWHLSLPNTGEKSLSEAITQSGTIFFTSYLPKDSTNIDINTGCSSSNSGGRLYALDVLTAKPSIDFNQDNTIDTQDAYINVSSQAIPETPQRVYNELNCSAEACNHEIDIRVNTLSKQTTTYNQKGLQNLYWMAP